MTTTQTTDQLTITSARLADDITRLIDATSTMIGTDAWLDLAGRPVREAIITAYNDATHYITGGLQAAQCADTNDHAATNARTSYSDAATILRLDVIDIIGSWTRYTKMARLTPTTDLIYAQRVAIQTARQLMRDIQRAEQELTA